MALVDQRTDANWLKELYPASERRVCGLLSLAVSSYRYQTRSTDEDLRTRLVELAREKPRFGYRRLHVLLQRDGGAVNHKRIYRVYCEAGLCIRRKKRKHCARTGRPLRTCTAANQEWAFDFVHDAIAAGRAIRVLSVVDAYTRESLAIEVGQKLKGEDVVRALNQIRMQRGVPKVLFCDNVLTAEHQEEVRDKISLRSPGERANEFRAKWLPRARVQALDHSDTRSIGDAVVFPVLKTRS